jgi:hypothetical protein
MPTSTTPNPSPVHPASEFVRIMSERHYLFLSQSLNDLERQIDRHRTEQHFIFDQLIQAGLVEPRTEPHAMDSRRQKTRYHHYHPYSRTSSPTSDIPGPSNSSSNEAAPATQAMSMPPFRKNRSSQKGVGTKRHPIVLHDDEPLEDRP